MKHSRPDSVLQGQSAGSYLTTSGWFGGLGRQSEPELTGLRWGESWLNLSQWIGGFCPQRDLTLLVIICQIRVMRGGHHINFLPLRCYIETSSRLLWGSCRLNVFKMPQPLNRSSATSSSPWQTSWLSLLGLSCRFCVTEFGNECKGPSVVWRIASIQTHWEVHCWKIPRV